MIKYRRRVAVKYRIISTIFLIVSTTSLFALDYSAHENNSRTLNAVMASGEIQYNDVEKLDLYLSKLPHKKHTAIYFDSPGGSLYGGIRLGEYFKQHRIKTVIDGNKICASACALAFLGGTDRNGNKWMSSTTTSRLGFHAFSSGDDTRYANRDETQRVVADILRYGKHVDAPMEIFIKNFSTPSNKIYWFSIHEELSLGIKVWDVQNNCFAKSDYVGNKTYGYTPEQKSASDFIRKYFSDLKRVPYSQTWNMLSNSMKHKVKSLKNYTKWWDGQVDRVVIESIKELESNVVRVRLKYYMKNGKTTCSQDTFTLKRDANSWFIYDQKYKKCFAG